MNGSTTVPPPVGDDASAPSPARSGLSRYVRANGIRRYAVGGANSWAEHVADGMRPAAPGVQTAVIPGAGHRVAEHGPQAMLEALDTFLAPYRAAA